VPEYERRRELAESGGIPVAETPTPTPQLPANVMRLTASNTFVAPSSLLETPNHKQLCYLLHI
jgi:hypothetical protein